MCGITGYFHRGAASADATVVAKMTATLRHRGPDAEGYWGSEKIALGHRRLSIIDLSDRSNQPLLDNSQRYVIVFNGEIYNYRELQSQLKEYSFRTQSDTEVVLAAFMQWGGKCLEYLKGMFAFAIWDQQRQSLFLARDRMGVKPLYYYQKGITFLFAGVFQYSIDSISPYTGRRHSGVERRMLDGSDRSACTRTVLLAVAYHYLYGGCGR
jgi:asparagine synthase (glutamine-hydrolysing)